jgi:regulator of replication initiation timing
MRHYKKIIQWGILSGVSVVVAGCMGVGGPFNRDPKPVEPVQQTDAAALKRFQDTNTESASAVDTAIELSKKYAALSEEMAKLQSEKLSLTAENNQLKQRLAAMEPEAAAAKKELAEANDLLVEMRIELNNWKTDVLGFRDEMRQADKAQLEALIKILGILGGELKAAPPASEAAAGAAN